MNYRFIHMADCHLGAWRDPKMRDVGLRSFCSVISDCLSLSVDFVLISGDLFNTALPSIDTLKLAVRELQKLKAASIPVYIIAGSHDYSSAGKTFLQILEEARLVVNVLQGEMRDEKLVLSPVVDSRTGVKLYGVLGRAQSLERRHFELLDRESIEAESGEKIFLFHTTVEELKPIDMKQIEGIPLSYFPKNCLYYAGGHVHVRRAEEFVDYGTVVYPGPTYPNSFSEVEKLHCGSYALCSVSEGVVSITHKQIELHPHKEIAIKCKDKTPSQVYDELIAVTDVSESIVTIRLSGKLSSGGITDIDFEKVFAHHYSQGAYFVMKNTNALSEEAFDEVSIDLSHIDSVEREVISEHVKINSSLFDVADIESLIQTLDTSKQDGEVVADFEKRVVDSVHKFVD